MAPLIPPKWAHLPNAAHIDRVLAHLTLYPDLWEKARDAASFAERGAAWGEAWDKARDKARDAKRCKERDAAWAATWAATSFAAWGVIYALVAWDDCEGILTMDRDAVYLLATHNHHPAILLLPAVVALNHS